MEYSKHDSSETDDDLPTQDMNRNSRGVQLSGAMGITSEMEPHGVDLIDMEFQIHRIETDAYGAVLRAFIAQSDVLSWGKEGLISELRKELRVSDVEHREILGKVNTDDLIKTIREWRKGTVVQQEPLPNMVNALGYVPISLGHAPHKRLKTAHVAVSSSPKCVPHVQPSSADIPSSLVAHVRENQWDGNTAIVSQTNVGKAIKPVPQNKQTANIGKGRGSMIVQSSRKGSVYSGPNTLKPGSDTIEIRATEKLIHEVERVCGGENPDPVQVERAKVILRDHERALIEAIAKLADVSDDNGSPDPRRHSPHEELKWNAHGFNNTVQVDRTVGYHSKSCNGDFADREGIPCIDLQDEE